MNNGKKISLVTVKSKLFILPILKAHIYNRAIESQTIKKSPFRYGKIFEDSFIIEKEGAVKPTEYINGKVISTYNGTEIILETSDKKLFFKLILTASLLFIAAIMMKEGHNLISLIFLLLIILFIRFTLRSSKEETNDSLEQLRSEIVSWIESDGKNTNDDSII